jgi:hypothetical protein
MSRAKPLLLVVFMVASLWPPLMAAGATLTPPPPPGSRCTGNPENTTCFFSFTIVQTGVFSGVDCGTFQVLENALVDINVKRDHDQNGDLVRATRYFRQPLAGSLNIWYNPDNLKAVPQVGDWNARFDFITPGDTSAAVETDTGALSRVLLPGGPVLIMDAGRIIFGPPPDFNIQFSAGPHRIETRDVARVCAALT